MKPASVTYLTIDNSREGQRIDNFLMAHLKGVPKSHVYRILRNGEVRVNKGRVKPSYRLEVDDILRIPPVRQTQSMPQRASKSLLEVLEAAVIYEDNHLLVLNKPAGLAVHGGSGIRIGAIEAMRQLRPKYKELELVHRLDRDTSGCLVFAKKRSKLRQLHVLWREQRVEKSYCALVKGQVARAWTQTAPLAKHILQSGERIAKVSADGKVATTHFSIIEGFKETSWLKVNIETGRMHQIRVHAAHSGHPIVGDAKYGDEAFNKQLADSIGSRLFLHARTISFELDNKIIALSAPFDETIETGLQLLRESTGA